MQILHKWVTGEREKARKAGDNFVCTGLTQNESTAAINHFIESLFLLQSFIGVFAITSLILSAIIDEKQKATNKL